MIFNMVGGGGGSGATLVVSSPANVSVTVSKDDKSYTKNSGSMGSTTFKGLATGTWTVTISGNGQTATKTIGITADYAITIAFFSASINITYPANSTCVVTNSGGQTVASDTNAGSSTKTWTATVGATGTYTVTATATDGSSTTSQSVSITADGQSVSVTLAYGYVIFDGTLTSGYSMASGSYGYRISDGTIYAGNGDNNFGHFCINPEIPTEYTTLKIRMKKDTVTGGEFRFGVSSSKSAGAWDPTDPRLAWVASSSVKPTEFTTDYSDYSLDISAVADKTLYIRVQSNAVAAVMTYYISRIWLE